MNLEIFYTQVTSIIYFIPLFISSSPILTSGPALGRSEGAPAPSLHMVSVQWRARRTITSYCTDVKKEMSTDITDMTNALCNCAGLNRKPVSVCVHRVTVFRMVIKVPVTLTAVHITCSGRGKGFLA